VESKPNGYITRWAVAQAASMASPEATRGMSSATSRDNAADERPLFTLARTTEYY
jgi:hypothetical protein